MRTKVHLEDCRQEAKGRSRSLYGIRVGAVALQKPIANHWCNEVKARHLLQWSNLTRPLFLLDLVQYEKEHNKNNADRRYGFSVTVPAPM
jgi:hypothetical protein